MRACGAVTILDRNVVSRCGAGANFVHKVCWRCGAVAILDRNVVSRCGVVRILCTKCAGVVARWLFWIVTWSPVVAWCEFCALSGLAL